ncbi:MAG: hypothetical protein IKG47_07420 [Oscillospiraceae bacterium]|nr:hypothetical protein [Oscillospiraceae bacterium]
MKYLDKLDFNKKKDKELKNKRLEVAVAAGASMAVLVLGVSLLTAFYAKTLMDINYIEESDVYDD